MADYHKEKFRNFMRMDLETFEELFELVNGLICYWSQTVVSFRVVSITTLLARLD